jgi:hypothetical protein
MKGKDFFYTSAESESGPHDLAVLEWCLRPAS